MGFNSGLKGLNVKPWRLRRYNPS